MVGMDMCAYMCAVDDRVNLLVATEDQQMHVLMDTKAVWGAKLSFSPVALAVATFRSSISQC